jgi:Ca-activated chloride channel family protein
MSNSTYMKRFFLMGMMMMMVIMGNAQNDRKLVRDGIRAYEDKAFANAEVDFRKAENINPESFEAEFNTGAALYGQEKYEETVKQYESLLGQTDNPAREAQIWHNIGNSLLEAQQYGPSIEAYKNSLRKNPADADTRYNLAYAKQKLKEQQQQQQNQKNQNQDKNKEQDQKNQNNQDQKDQQKQDQNNDQQKKDQNNDQQNQDQQKQQQQPQPQEISKEDAERMLNAIQQQEKDVKDKVDKKKAAVAKVKTEKDW